MGRIVDYNLTEELAHGIYVSKLAGRLSEELGMDDDVVYEMRVAGLVHDIGKLRLQNSIFEDADSEPPLIVEEIEFVRQHSVLSYEILKNKGYSDFILESVRHHHENYDGTGYPDNLRGEDIPPGSRVLRPCDVFAALTTDRPYRRKFSADEAFQLIIDEANHFDLRVLLAFQRVVHEVGTDYQVFLPYSDADLLEEAKKIVRGE